MNLSDTHASFMNLISIQHSRLTSPPEPERKLELNIALVLADIVLFGPVCRLISRAALAAQNKPRLSFLSENSQLNTNLHVTLRVQLHTPRSSFVICEWLDDHFRGRWFDS